MSVDLAGFQHPNLLVAYAYVLPSRKTGTIVVAASGRPRKLAFCAPYRRRLRRTRGLTQLCNTVVVLCLFPKILNSAALGEAHIDDLSTEFEEHPEIKLLDDVSHLRTR